MNYLFNKKGSGYKCVINDGEPVNSQKLSVDVLFNSLLDYNPQGVHAVILTGMGNDGAQGTLELLQAGAKKASSTVWGIPG